MSKKLETLQKMIEDRALNAFDEELNKEFYSTNMFKQYNISLEEFIKKVSAHRESSCAENINLKTIEIIVKGLIREKYAADRVETYTREIVKKICDNIPF